MKNYYKRYSYVLLATSFFISIFGFLITAFGIIIQTDPTTIADIQATVQFQDEVNNKDHYCNRNNLHLCQVAKDLSKMKNFTKWFGDAGYLIFIMGFIIIVHSVIGAIGVVAQHNKFLLFMVIVICASIGMNYYAMDIFNFPYHEFHVEVKKRIKKNIKDEYKLTGDKVDSVFTQGFNLVMMTLGCCGVEEWYDMPNPTELKDADGKEYTFDMPPACCDRAVLKEYVNKNYKEAFDTTSGEGNETKKMEIMNGLNCREVMLNVTRISPRGCYEKFHSIVYNSHGTEVFLGLTFLVWYQSMQIIFALMTCLSKPLREEIIFEKKMTASKADKKRREKKERRRRNKHGIQQDESTIMEKEPIVSFDAKNPSRTSLGANNTKTPTETIEANLALRVSQGTNSSTWKYHSTDIW